MLSDLPRPDRFAEATNLVARDGVLATRRGWSQRTDADLAAAEGFGDRFLVQQADGALAALDDAGLHPLGVSGPLRTATRFAALTEAAARERRVYFSDGETLRYLALAGGGYTVSTPVNTCLDPGGLPYPIPVPVALATWRGRLWAADGTNRARHSDANLPHYWDPLWTLEFQADGADRVRSLVPLGETLVVGCERSLWTVTGRTQYDWVTNEVLHGRGVVGPHAMVGDGSRCFYLSERGLYQLGSDQALSDPDLTETFSSPDPAASLALSADGRYLWVRQHARLLVCDTLTDGPRWSELDAPDCAQVLRAGGVAVWCGASGLWLEAGAQDVDRLYSGRRKAVSQALETWDTVPNGRGRSVCERVFLTLRAARGGVATVTPYSDGTALPSRTVSLAGGLPAADFTFSDGTVLGDVTVPVVREVPVGRAGNAFRFRLATDSPFELWGQEIKVRGGAG